MTDSKLRELERRWKETQSVEDKAAWIRERIRTGDLGDWIEVEVPPIAERLMGFSVPVGNRVLVVSYKGMHVLWLEDVIKVDHDLDHAEYDLYDPERGQAGYGGVEYEIVGLHGGRPIHASPYGEELILDQDALRVSVVHGDRMTLLSGYEDFSGDWAAATFSPDGRHIVLGCPYGFDFRVWRRSWDTISGAVGK